VSERCEHCGVPIIKRTKAQGRLCASCKIDETHRQYDLRRGIKVGARRGERIKRRHGRFLYPVRVVVGNACNGHHRHSYVVELYAEHGDKALPPALFFIEPQMVKRFYDVDSDAKGLDRDASLAWFPFGVPSLTYEELRPEWDSGTKKQLWGKNMDGTSYRLGGRTDAETARDRRFMVAKYKRQRFIREYRDRSFQRRLAKISPALDSLRQPVNNDEAPERTGQFLC
jgi:hypothetical protein